MTDPRGDVEITTIGLVNIALPEIDILAGWVTPLEDGATFGWRVDDVTHQTFPSQYSLFAWHFSPTDTFRSASVQVRHLTDGSWEGNFDGTTWANERIIVYFPVEVSGTSVIELTVRGVDLGFPPQTIVASSILKSTDVSLPPNVGFRDWVDAPDSLIEIPTGPQE